MTMAHPGPTCKEIYICKWSEVPHRVAFCLPTHSSTRPVSLLSQMEHADMDRVSYQDPFPSGTEQVTELHSNTSLQFQGPPS